MDFHTAFDSYMESHNISNYKMSKDTGISDSLISYWRSGKRKPTLENLIIISKYLGISIDNLINGNNCISKMSDIPLNDDEEELINNYRKLDNRGKHKLHTVIYEELDRMNEAPPSSAEKVS